MEKWWHNTDITKNQFLPKFIVRQEEDIEGETQRFLASSGSLVDMLTTTSCLLHMLRLWDRVATLFLSYREKCPNTDKIFSVVVIFVVFVFNLLPRKCLFFSISWVLSIIGQINGWKTLNDWCLSSLNHRNLVFEQGRCRRTSTMSV